MHPTSETASRNLLVVDDDAYVIKSLVRLLRPYFDHIFTALGAEQAMDILSLGAVTVVISEMLIPPLSTAALFRKAKHAQPSAITVLLTGKNDISGILRGKRDGIVDVFLPKPWTNEDVLAAVRIPTASHHANDGDRTTAAASNELALSADPLMKSMTSSGQAR